MSPSELAYLSLDELGRFYLTGSLSPVEVTEALLARIERHNPQIHAFLKITADEARKQARTAEAEIRAGEWRGPLHGVPVSVKDLFYTRGIATTGGSPIYRDFAPDFDSTVVARLKAAGAVLLGKTHLHELAYGITNDNPHYGPCLNPWDEARVPGGSSGGSAAAVSAGLSFASYGTDTGGSIRIPASYCGVTGLKPTYGRISRYGVIPLSVNLDHVGSFARTVKDAAVAAEIVSGVDKNDPSSLREACASWGENLERSIHGWRIGVVRGSFIGRLHPEIAQAAANAERELERAGAELEEIEIPDAVEAGEVAHLLQMADGAAVYHRQIIERPEMFGQDVRVLIEQGHLVSAVDYINAQRFRRQFQKTIRMLFERLKAIVLPATPIPAPYLKQRDVELAGALEDIGLASTRLVRPFNFAGVPVLTVPCGFTHTGLPFGMQIVTRAGDELTGLSLGDIYQKRTRWHTRMPCLAADRG
jgi:aspartyl-tRNA(Asn)/glutamyl-tRNA(Gln) amidotransferase subunit A